MINTSPGRGRLDMARRLETQDAQRLRASEARRVPGSEDQTRRDEAAEVTLTSSDERVRGTDASEESARARYLERGLGMPQREQRPGAVEVAPLRLPGTPAHEATADVPRLPGSEAGSPAPAGDAPRTPAEASPSPQTAPHGEGAAPAEGTAQEAGRSSGDTGDEASNDAQELSDPEQRRVAELKQRDAEVRRHEMAHVVAGGQYTGAPSYQFERGPDGRAYAVAGSVPVDVSPVPGDPQETIKKMRQVKRAALAPAEPSSADRRVAAQADQAAAKARVELRQERVAEATERAPQPDAAADDQGLSVGSGEPRGARATVMTFQALRAYGSSTLQSSTAQSGTLESTPASLETGRVALESAAPRTLRSERESVVPAATLQSPKELPAPRPAPTPSSTVDGSMGQPDG
ncbi:MAG: putative metalloprotease CJM1_0395 family protein [Myxococcota bacterium]